MSAKHSPRLESASISSSAVEAVAARVRLVARRLRRQHHLQEEDLDSPQLHHQRRLLEEDLDSLRRRPRRLLEVEGFRWQRPLVPRLHHRALRHLFSGQLHHRVAALQRPFSQRKHQMPMQQHNLQQPRALMRLFPTTQMSLTLSRCSQRRPDSLNCDRLSG